MPIYEYRCNQCDCDFELFIWSARDEDNLKCPKCNHRDVKRVLSACSAKTGAGALGAAACGPSSGGFS